MDIVGFGHGFEQSREYQFGLHCAQRQRGLKAWQFGIVSLVIVASAPQSLEEHVSVCLSHTRPSVDNWQSIATQEQLSLLGKEPSVMGHDLNALQNEEELVQ